ncbi:methylisocitrate lyase [Legionella taurinensis]|uniref:2-methylisocitrate lyase n=1 Tax=Legionella taurinensis TaxID=70611 RepID=A0A3A5M0S4_9GAMM|nr:methylisocitrate lyase [Legionella taurinensis]PUT42411.1 methylisocitrate lyase [Legionella taurinensis]PUT43937.1 methylisocitrate lyase [Legionella taurinensis]PUT47192.1 methylisocitrate lyase [Legionella taurinensis]RJT48357.1 methylisocitrate lyase [Legionella taurinensis]
MFRENNVSSCPSGRQFRKLVREQAPLQVMGTINAYSAMLAKQAGCQAIYLSGAGVANASYGLPDLGMTNLSEVLDDARRITDACDLPLLVDVDTGWGHAFNIARTVKLMEKTGVAAIHIEDQVLAKRCGHRPNKAIVSQQEMADRIKAAVDARRSDDFVIMARTDAYAVEGMAAAVDRALRCVELGADMIFPEAMTQLEEYREFAEQVKVPVLANITEFGKTPLFTRQELADAGVGLILYPLSAFRAMAYAALKVYTTVVQEGTQRDLLDIMQTRSDLYDVLGYHDYEKKLDELMEGEHGQ